MGSLYSLWQQISSSANGYWRLKQGDLSKTLHRAGDIGTIMGFWKYQPPISCWWHHTLLFKAKKDQKTVVKTVPYPFELVWHLFQEFSQHCCHRQPPRLLGCLSTPRQPPPEWHDFCMLALSIWHQPRKSGIAHLAYLRWVLPWLSPAKSG